MVISNFDNGKEGFEQGGPPGKRVFKNIAVQQADISLVESCARQSDFQLKSFLSNDILELYYDIFHHDKSVCDIYKGWKDPGFRFSNFVDLKRSHNRFREILDGISKICSKYMLTQTCSDKPKEDNLRVVFEVGVYDGGLNESVFKEVMKNFEAAVAEIQSLTAVD